MEKQWVGFKNSTILILLIMSSIGAFGQLKIEPMIAYELHYENLSPSSSTNNIEANGSVIALNGGQSRIGHGFGLGTFFIKDELLFSVKLGLCFWSENYVGSGVVNYAPIYSYNLVDPDITNRNRVFNFDIQATGVYGNASVGIGGIVTPKDWQFRCAPILRLNPEMLLYRKFKNISIVDSYSDSETDGAIVKSYDTLNSELIRFGVKNSKIGVIGLVEPSIGINFGGSFDNNLNIFVELGIEFQDVSRVVLLNRIQTPWSAYVNYGVSYCLGSKKQPVINLE